MELVIIIILIILFFVAEIVFYKKFLLKNVEYTLSFSQVEAFEGDQMYVDEEIHNRKPIAIPWIKADIHASKNLIFAGGSSVLVDEERFVTSGFALRGYQKTKRRWYMDCSRRGYYNIENATITCGDLLNLVTESKAMPINTKLIVYPGIVELSSMFFSSKDIMGDATVQRFILADPFIVKGTREYVPGDTMNKINWKATARYNSLMVKENDFTTKIGITTLLNIQSAEDEYELVSNRELIEFAIKCAATILYHGTTQGMPVRFGTNSCVVDDDQMIMSQAGSGQEHLISTLAILAKLRMKNVRSFDIFLDKFKNEMRDTQVYIVTAFLSDDIVNQARVLLSKGNTVKFLVLDERDASMNVPRDMEVFFMKRKLEEND